MPAPNPILSAISELIDTDEGRELMVRVVAAINEAKHQHQDELEARATARRLAEQERLVEENYRRQHDLFATKHVIGTQPSKVELERLQAETERELATNPVLIETAKSQRQRNYAIERIRMSGITETAAIEARLAEEGY